MNQEQIICNLTPYQYVCLMQQWFQRISQMDTQNHGFPPFQILNFNRQQDQRQPDSCPQQSWSMIIEDEKQSLTRGSFTEMNSIPRQLNLDDLIKQGRLYNEESSNSFVDQQKCQEKKKINSHTKPLKKQIKQSKKIDRVQPKEKNIQLGLKCQQLNYPMSKLKPKLIRIYQKNNEKFQQLFDNLKIIYPECTDMDVIRLLELGDHNFDKAFKLLQESELFVHYYITVQGNENRQQDLSDQEVQTKKR